jgi:hypothetical protein
MGNDLGSLRARGQRYSSIPTTKVDRLQRAQVNIAPHHHLVPFFVLVNGCIGTRPPDSSETWAALKHLFVGKHKTAIPARQVKHLYPSLP